MKISTDDFNVTSDYDYVWLHHLSAYYKYESRYATFCGKKIRVYVNSIDMHYTPADLLRINANIHLCSSYNDYKTGELTVKP